MKCWEGVNDEMSHKERVMYVGGQQAEDCNLRRLAAALKVGQEVSGYYRYFLFGFKAWDCPFELKRVSDKEALLVHLKEKHKFSIAKAA